MGTVLKKRKDAGLTVKMTKRKMGRPKVLYLGYWTEEGQICLDPLKVESIVNWPVP